MKSLAVLSLDPGCTRCGWAHLTLHRVATGGRFVYDRGGHRELDRGWLTAELQQLREEGGVFALEVLIGGRFKGRSTHTLLETRAMEQDILNIAAAVGFDPPRREPLPLVEQKGVWTLLISAGDGLIERVLGTERVRSPNTGRLYSRNATERVQIHGWRGALCHTSRPSDKQIEAVVTPLIEGIPALNCREREHVLDAAGLAIVAVHRFLGIPVRLSAEVEQALLLQKLADKAAPERKQARLYSRAMREQIGARSKAARAAR